MTLASRLDAILDLVHHDAAGRGLGRHPRDGLFNTCRHDFAAACQSIARAPRPVLGIVTGFPILACDPVRAETDGPPGAVFLARALVPLGVRVLLASEPMTLLALAAGLRAAGLADAVSLHELPSEAQDPDAFTTLCWQGPDRPTHTIALERVGPGHTLDSLRHQPGSSGETLALFASEVQPADRGRCRNMRGRDITSWVRPAHLLFEAAPGAKANLGVTLGLGDGGNEIGMGNVPWHLLRRDIPSGGLTACRVPTDFLVMAGVSNWAAYALAVGTVLARGHTPDPSLFDPHREHDLLAAMVEQGPLVDGVTGRPTVTVDGLPFDEYVRPLQAIGRILEAHS